MYVDEVDSRPQWSKNSHYSKETSKWDLPKSRGGMRPDSKEEFPKMVYMARRKEDGGPWIVNDPQDEQFSRTCQLTVNDESQLARALNDGWRETPGEALHYAKVEHPEKVALQTAHRHHDDRRLSPKAQAEAREADESTSEHLPEIPEKPRGRKPRSAA